MDLLQQIASFGLQALLFIIGLTVVGVLLYIAFWAVVLCVFFPLMWLASLIGLAKMPSEKPDAE